MSVTVQAPDQVISPCGGLRMSAEEFFDLPDDGLDYELLDGVLLVTPSPEPQHQWVLAEVVAQLVVHLKAHPVGKAFPETDIHLGQIATGQDLVYKPELVYYSAERLKQMGRRLVGPPDLVVEIVSPMTRRYDTETKRDDYERCGVREYWIIDPQRDSLTFLRHDGQRFVEVLAEGDRFASQAVEGFVLNLTDVRATFKS